MRWPREPHDWAGVSRVSSGRSKVRRFRECIAGDGRRWAVWEGVKTDGATERSALLCSRHAHVDTCVIVL